jgi:hypothetical protein
MQFGGQTEVEGTPKEPANFFPFSKPSPFSSMTDWPFGKPTNNDEPSKHHKPKREPEHEQRHYATAQNARRSREIPEEHGRTSASKNRKQRPQKLPPHDPHKTQRLNVWASALNL